MKIISFFANHIYLLSALVYAFLWIIFFIADKKNRKRMIYVSLAGMILGPFAQAMHLTDWWRPDFVFDSFIKLEDIIFGFSVGGVISASYDIIRNRIKGLPFIQVISWLKILMIFIFLFILFGLHYIFGVHSFWTSIISLAILAVILCLYNPRFLLPLFLTGVFSVIVALAGYLLAIYINPTWVQKVYLLEKLSGVLVLGLPIEELAWFFFAAIGVSAFQEMFLSNNYV